MLAHGGAQVQILQTKAALERIGVEVAFLEWWNERQTGDILHHFGFLPFQLINLARLKGWKVVNTALLSQTCNRSRWELLLRKLCIRSALAAPLGQNLKTQLPWHSFRLQDQIFVSLEAEKWVLEHVYGVGQSSVTVVPLGLSEAFLQAEPGTRMKNYLICPGTIYPVKNSVELARLARAAQVPVLFVGKPYDDISAYWEQFRQLVDNEFVLHHAHVQGERAMIDLLRGARGLVLMSQYENWSLAAHEAAACGLPLLLSDQKWARERFGSQAHYFSKRGKDAAVASLQNFYRQSPGLPAPKVRLYSWTEVAEVLRTAYANLLQNLHPP
jgi:glycosyltransferase involved in cell wall biosynthesis